VNDTVAVSQADVLDAAPNPLRVHGQGGRLLRSLAATALAAVLLGVVFPRLVGMTLADLRSAFSAVSWRDAGMLLVLWALGLFVHSFVLTGALPGLTRRRALTLNLTGSAVANVIPFGGAAGMSMNYVMIRAWGVEVPGYAAFTLVTNLWGILLKLVMPAVALGVLWASGGTVSAAIRWAAVASGGVLAVVALGIAVVASRRASESAVAPLAKIVAAAGRLLRRRRDPVGVGVALLTCRDVVASVVARRWAQLSAGTAGYGLLQAVLLWACLHAVGADVAPAAVLAGYAVDRVMTLAVITPGAVGFAEAGTAATLIALGGSPVAVAAGVLLYRGFTYALEIPVGGAWLAAWLFQRRRARRRSGWVAGRAGVVS
jgi:uncharacterized membrane protein YbhN (UPF0104 family)